MELREYLATLRRYWVSIVVVTLAGTVMGVAASLVQAAPVTAESAVFISVRDGTTAREVLGGASFVSTQVQSYLRVATSPMVLQPVIDKLALDTTPTDLVKESLSVSVPTGTTIIQIGATQDDSALAVGIAQGVAEQLVQTVGPLSPKDPSGEKTVVATIIAPAVVVTPEGRGFSLAAVRLGLLAGLILAVGQALVRLLLDRSISSARQAVRATGHEILAEIPLATDPLANEQLDPYRRLRTNLDAVLPADAERGRSLVVTSAAAGEGKTVTAINLATACAASGQTVLLVETNLHRPQIAEAMGLDPSPGLTSVLSGQKEMDDVVQVTPNGNLHVVAAGTTANDPADLLSSTDMAQLVEDAVRKYDYVVVDAPAVTETSAAATIATLASGSLLVVGTGVATVDSVKHASTILKRAGATTLGVVLNDHPSPRS